MLIVIFISVVLAFTFLPNPPQLLEVIFKLERGSLNPALIMFFWVIIFLIALFAFVIGALK
jgi:hypothetical protein